jgi:NET1-associated nuclear protein 1 (U3 small nucleolar RNA-associated protein 17)
MEKWDWVSGVKQGAWDIASRISGLQVAASGVPESMSEIVYTVDSKSEKWSITAHRLGQGTNTELKTLFKPNRPVSNLRVLAGGLFVVASSEERLILGSLQKTASTALKDVVYEWREVKCLEFITCLDARISNAEPASSGVPASPSSLDIAVGGITGAVFVYRDHFGQLKHREHGKGAVDITPSRYHWHRTSVGAVKWSIDGLSSHLHPSYDVLF